VRGVWFCVGMGEVWVRLKILFLCCGLFCTSFVSFCLLRLFSFFFSFSTLCSIVEMASLVGSVLGPVVSSCSKLEISFLRDSALTLWWIFRSFSSWIWVPRMIFCHFFLKFLSASSACSEMLIFRPPGVMLFLSEALTNCKCETCLACLSFSALRCFISCECSGF